VLEPRSNTMKMGICKDDLAPSLGRADEVFLLQPQHIPWQVAEVADACIQPAHWSADVDALADMVVKAAQPGDHILVMSNGGFGGIHQKLLDGLAKKAEAVIKIKPGGASAYRAYGSGFVGRVNAVPPGKFHELKPLAQEYGCGFPARHPSPRRSTLSCARSADALQDVRRFPTAQP